MDDQFIPILREYSGTVSVRDWILLMIPMASIFIPHIGLILFLAYIGILAFWKGKFAPSIRNLAKALLLFVIGWIGLLICLFLIFVFISILQLFFALSIIPFQLTPPTWIN